MNEILNYTLTLNVAAVVAIEDRVDELAVVVPIMACVSHQTINRSSPFLAIILNYFLLLADNSPPFPTKILNYFLLLTNNFFWTNMYLRPSETIEYRIIKNSL